MTFEKAVIFKCKNILLKKNANQNYAETLLPLTRQMSQESLRNPLR